MSTHAVACSAVLLAAGRSTRMAGACKQLLPVPTAHGACAAVRVVAQALLEAGMEEVVVVTGPAADLVRLAVQGMALRVCRVTDAHGGQMHSVATGVAALTRPCRAVMICLADMPLLRAEDYRALAEAFADLPRQAIMLPYHRGQRGHPVVFSAQRVPEVRSGALHPGCRRLIAAHPDDVVRFETGHDRCLVDMDTPEDYAAVCWRLAARAQALAAQCSVAPLPVA